MKASTSSFWRTRDVRERIRIFYKREDPELGAGLHNELLELFQHPRNSEDASTETSDFLTENIKHIESVSSERNVERDAWKATPVSAEALAIPGMLDEDTMRYYSWLGSNYTGAGDVVELGCWLGRATVCLAETLSKNSRFADRSIQVFDSFRWEPWMWPYVADNAELRDSFRIGESFLELFRQYCGAYEHLVQPNKQLLNTHREDTRIPVLTWKGEPVEILLYDFGQEYEEITNAWEMFLPSFIPGKTVFVVQPYGNPHAEMLRRFCRDHANQLKPMHKPDSASKGFVFIR